MIGNKMQKTMAKGLISDEEVDRIAESVLEQVDIEGPAALRRPEVRQSLFLRSEYWSVASKVAMWGSKGTLLEMARDRELLEISNKFNVRVSTLLLIHGGKEVLSALNATRAAPQARK
jgi:hypothetical protein